MKWRSPRFVNDRHSHDTSLATMLQKCMNQFGFLNCRTRLKRRQCRWLFVVRKSCHIFPQYEFTQRPSDTKISPIATSRFLQSVPRKSLVTGNERQKDVHTNTADDGGVLFLLHTAVQYSSRICTVCAQPALDINEKMICTRTRGTLQCCDGYPKCVPPGPCWMCAHPPKPFNLLNSVASLPVVGGFTLSIFSPRHHCGSTALFVLHNTIPVGADALQTHTHMCPPLYKRTTPQAHCKHSTVEAVLYTVQLWCRTVIPRFKENCISMYTVPVCSF